VSAQPPSDQLRRGVWHKDGPVAQVRTMAEWVEEMADRCYTEIPSQETMRKVVTNLRAAADLLASDEEQAR
jgi:hypothetical protein